MEYKSPQASAKKSYKTKKYGLYCYLEKHISLGSS